MPQKPPSRRAFLQTTAAALSTPLLGKLSAATLAPQISETEPRTAPLSFADLHEALSQPWGTLFWLERKSGKYQMGDPQSDFNANLDFEHLTFDISNNKVLANMTLNGTLKNVTIYRDSYRMTCAPGKLNGVWTAKDNASYGPYSYRLEIAGELHDLAAVDWDMRIGLLDNLFPITELRDPQGRFVVRLLACAPISADGTDRARALLYWIHIENISSATLTGTIRVPPPFEVPQRADLHALPINIVDPCDFEIGAGDGDDFKWELPFSLQPGGRTHTCCAFYMPGDSALAAVAKRGSLQGLAETWSYYRGRLGRLKIPAHPYLAEFFERQMMQAFQTIAMSPSDDLAGANWGSYPATRSIWSKDTYYACIAPTLFDPRFAQKIILWFDEYGVRQKGNLTEGGVLHSTSISVAAIVLAGIYYRQTGDKSFFLSHPEFESHWGAILDEIIGSRKDPDIWLYPTRFISDGAILCDYHTGTNVVVWRALEDYARLLRDVYGKPARAQNCSVLAGKTHAAILQKTVIAGPFGPQFIEGTYRDGRAPEMASDGEESDTTLMPFYSFLEATNDLYRNYMHFAISSSNLMYNPPIHAISWGGSLKTPISQRVASTAPGYAKGIAAQDADDPLFGDHGGYTEIRKVTDADGSVWWWSYGGRGVDVSYGRVVRGVPGKAGWFAGVHTAVFLSHFLGISFDAPAAVLNFHPLPALGDQFAWNDFPMGSFRFSVSYERNAAGVRNVTATNHNSRAFRLRTFDKEIALPPGKSVTVAIAS
jgi:hypothetical protein